MSNNKCFCLMNLSYLYVFIFYSVFFCWFLFSSLSFWCRQAIVISYVYLEHVSFASNVYKSLFDASISGMCRTQRQIDIQRQIEKILLYQCKHLSKRIKMHLFDSFFFIPIHRKRNIFMHMIRIFVYYSMCRTNDEYEYRRVAQ